MKSVEEVMARLDPKIRKHLQTADSAIIEKQKTPVPTLNDALNGGLAFGRQVLIYGTKSSGKTMMCLQTVAQAQRDGRVCAWVDAEKSYDPKWAARLGVDNESLIYVSANSVNDIVRHVSALIEAEIDIVVIDSISAGLSGAFFDKDGKMKDLEDTGQIGSDAKAWTHAVKMFNYLNENTLIILISQARTHIGNSYTESIPTGGQAVKFFSSTIIKLASNNSTDIKYRKVVKNGKALSVPQGRQIHWKIQYNKTGEPEKTGEYTLYFAGDQVGIDWAADIFNKAASLDIIQRAGTWYTVYGKQLQGADNAIEYIKENEEVFNQLLKDVND